MFHDFMITCEGSVFIVNLTDHDSTAFPLGVFLLLVYPIGVPAAYFYILKKAKLQNPFTKAKLGDMYEAYNDDSWYFELVDLLFRLTITSMVSFVPLMQELQAAMCVLLLYFVAILIMKPYVQKGADKLRQLTLTELLLYMMLGYVMTNTTGFESKNDPLNYALAAVMIFMVMAQLIGALVMVDYL